MYEQGVIQDPINVDLSVYRMLSQHLEDSLDALLMSQVSVLSKLEYSYAPEEAQKAKHEIAYSFGTDSDLARDLMRSPGKNVISLTINHMSKKNASRLNTLFVNGALSRFGKVGGSLGPFYRVMDPEDFSTWEDLGFLPVILTDYASLGVTDSGSNVSRFLKVVAFQER